MSKSENLFLLFNVVVEFSHLPVLTTSFTFLPSEEGLFITPVCTVHLLRESYLR